MKRFEKAEILLHRGDLESDIGFGMLLKHPLTDGTANNSFLPHRPYTIRSMRMNNGSTYRIAHIVGGLINDIQWQNSLNNRSRSRSSPAVNIQSARTYA